MEGSWSMEEPTEEYRYDEGEGEGEGEGSSLPFARGGPINNPDFLSSITSVFEFKAAVLQELEGLEAELVSAGDFDEELSVDEIKVYTEEELVEEALKEGSEDVLESADSSQLLLEYGDDGAVDHSVPSALSNSSSLRTCDPNDSEKSLQQKKSRKRGRVFDRKSRASELEGSYLAKVKQLAKVKEKQDEDKLAARLHSFSGNCKSSASAISAAEQAENIKYRRFITTPLKVKLSSLQEHVPLCNSEVVLRVQIYHTKRTALKTQEFLVLGSQTLSEVRDNIYCLTDQLMQTAEEHDPSGYFLIEGTFCNDVRDPSANDYSEPIFDWLRNCKNEATQKWKAIMSGDLKSKHQKLIGDLDISNVPDFKASCMHKTRFCDLQFRLGSGYLYCHQGNCKHTMVISDMRLIHPADAQNQLDYPLLTFQHQIRRIKCSVCQIYHAAKMTVDDKWAPENPCYFCKNCYFLLHYDEDGTLLYPHSVFDYYHE